MKRILISIITIAAMAIMLTSCAETDVKLSKNIDGTWNATSYKVSGVELLGSILQSVTMKFNNEGEGMGTVTITTAIDFLGTVETDVTTGTYQTIAGDNGDQLIVTTVEDGVTDVVTMDMELSGKNITLNFTEDGEAVVITAEKQ
jgi:hypothetical protein